MSVQIHEELADALVEVIEGIGLRAYKWPRPGIKLPSAVIEMPTIRRVEPDEAEDHLGASDWRLNFPVIFYKEVGRGDTVIADQVELMGLALAFVQAIDHLKPGSDGLILNELCTDAKVVSAEPFGEDETDDSRRKIGYETRVSILTFQ